MDGFVFNISQIRVVFGQGSVNKLPEELAKLEITRPVILSSPGQVRLAERLKIILDGRCGGMFNKAVMHTPVEVTERAVKYTLGNAADGIVSIGGGSTVGLGKAISVRTGLKHLSIPTTYSGNEMTAILGETKDGVKETKSDPKILPATVIYDVDLTLTLPPAISATSGVNAIAHAVEALYAREHNPVITLLALEAIKAMAAALPDVVKNPESVPARNKALYGAWLCAFCLANVGMALHHKLCHTLGGSFNLPHAETHTCVLPHALAYNAPAVPQAMEKLATVLPDGEGDAAKGLNVLLAKLGVKRALKDFGMQETDIDKGADIATNNPYWNPRDLDRNKLREVIRRAWAGEDARADL